MDYEGRTNCDFDQQQSINELNVSSNDVNQINVIPRPRRFVKENGDSLVTTNHSLGEYQVSPYAWQPTNNVSVNQPTFLSDYPENYDDIPEIAGFVYIDPDQIISEVKTPAKVGNTGSDARKVCRKISDLLKDKESPSRGSRMFQKRRKRAAKFTLIGYGTQPPEDNRYSEPQDCTSSSEELSRIDYSTENEDIEVYDTPGLRNALTSGNNLNPSQQLIQKQFKNLAMDVGGMRGKGAKIFAKRQQRMENYVITDENRRNSRNRIESQDFDLETEKPKNLNNGPYVRPGSTIAISSKTPQFNKPMNKPKALSDYCTDVEDDHRISRTPQINYFSDCENMERGDQSRHRRSRPIHRRGWQPEQEQATQNENNNIENIFSDLPPTPPSMRSLTSESDDVFLQRSPIRKVVPPNRVPLCSPARSQGSRETSLSRTTSLSPARTEVSTDEPQQPKRSWSRVRFSPRKPTVAPQTNTAVIDYPCARSQSSSIKNVVGKNLVSRAPSHSPKRQIVQQKIAFTKPPMPNVSNNSTPHQNQPNNIHNAPSSMNGQKGVQPNISHNISQTPPRSRNPSFNSKEETPQYKSGAAVSLLEKPMKPKTIPVPKQYSEIEKLITHPNQITNGVTENDFVQPLVNHGIDTQAHVATDIQNVNEDALREDEANKETVTEDDNVRVSSPASVLSYMSSNSSTYTSMLPSRCLTPPTRPYTPNASRAIKIVTGNGEIRRSEPVVKQNVTTSVYPQHTSQEKNFSNTYQPIPPINEKIGSSTICKNELAQEQNVTKSVQPSTQQNLPEKLNTYQPKTVKPEPVIPIAPPLPPKGDKISACLKVLDTSKPLFQPKPKVEYQPSPTMIALLQSENESGYGNMTTPSVSYKYPCKKATEIKSPSVEQKAPVKTPVSNFSYSPPQSMRKRLGSTGQPPQPLGIVAGEMKGKGAKMFEKQQKRMEKYSKETTSEDFPELQKTRSTNSPTVVGSFSYQQPHISRFSPVTNTLEEKKVVKNGMREVMGEFQKSSKPGKAKRPSDNKRKRDPLHYQQQLFYRPPSAADFVQSTNAVDLQSDASSIASSRTNISSSSDCRSDTVPMTQQSDMVPPTSPTASRSSLGGDNRYTNSSSSISSQKSGPKTAPKPSRALITRQLSKPTSPTPVVSTSPTPDIITFDLTPASPSMTFDQDKTFSFKGTDETGDDFYDL